MSRFFVLFSMNWFILMDIDDLGRRYLWNVMKNRYRLKILVVIYDLDLSEGVGNVDSFILDGITADGNAGVCFLS